MAATSEDSARSLRWNLRVSRPEDDVVRAASELSETGLTGFVRDAALSEAHRVLADRTHFELDAGTWEQFTELLDRPAEVRPELVELFSRQRPE